jgi:heptosyltransferase-1
LRVLIVKVSSLGDVIHTLPAVTDAHQAHRDLVFDWVVEENFVEVPAWHPAVDRVIPIALRRWRHNLLKSSTKTEFRAFKQELQAVHYDLVIDAQGLIKSGIISRLSHGLTIGLSDRTIREPLATMFYNKVYSVPWTEHAVDRVRQLFSRALQHSYNKNVVDYGINLECISGGEPAPVRRQVVFLHGTTWATKHWPEMYWRHLAQIAAAANYDILLPWGNETERQRAQFIARDNNRVTVLDRTSLTGLAGHILQSQGVIAVDTGLGHLSAALNKPTISLYGATNPDLSGTFGANQLHLNSSLACAPCVKKTCTYTGQGFSDDFEDQPFAVTPPCFATHKPDTVWQQFEQLIGT